MLFLFFLLVALLRDVLLDADILIIRLPFIVAKGDIVRCSGMRGLPKLLISHELVVEDDVALGEELELAVPVAVDVGQFGSHERVLDQEVVG